MVQPFVNKIIQDKNGSIFSEINELVYLLTIIINREALIEGSLFTKANF